VSASDQGPVLFAYDGSDLAKHAIEVAGRELAPEREAVVATVWRTFNVGFVPAGEREFDAASSNEVREAAEETAAYGASLANAAGFRAESLAVNATPVWKGIAQAAEERDASLIVLGSHGKRGFPGKFLGSVSGAVAGHAPRSVLIVHRRV
jgi:nucleotide-binding universal stress UspA family protein